MLEHSRSSNDLKSPSPRIGQNKAEDSDTDNSRNIRPGVGKLRRRSTLNWSNATPGVRQKKLEDVTKDRLADTWFSIHCSDISEPIYVSEVVEKAMNPSFRFFDLNAYGPFVSRRDELTIKYWAKTESINEYILLIELQLHLRSLQFVGKSVWISLLLALGQALTTVHSWMTFTIPYLRIAFFSIFQMVFTQALQTFPRMSQVSLRPSRRDRFHEGKSPLHHSML